MKWQIYSHGGKLILFHAVISVCSSNYVDMYPLIGLRWDKIQEYNKDIDVKYVKNTLQHSDF